MPRTLELDLAARRKLGLDGGARAAQLRAQGPEARHAYSVVEAALYEPLAGAGG